ncbi:MAG: substrate-binding domain-containing protein [Armatimonadetes bacterium]|nr:substrate-binding domain-containing protein [Armatimonadota bacterium]
MRRSLRGCLLPLLPLLASCARPTAEVPAPVAAPPERGVLVISNANSPFWDAVDAGCQAGAQEFGLPARLERNDGTVPGQIRLLEQALASHAQLAGVAVSVLRPDAPGILQAMQQLRAAGLPVITVDSDCQPDARQAFVGTNNVAAGKALGAKLATLKPAGGKVCVFVGDPSAQNARDRQDGFFQGAGSKFTVAEVYKDDTDPTKARTNVESALVAHPDATVFLGLWSYNGPAIAEAVQNAGKAAQVTVAAFDAEPNLLPLLEQGQVAAALVQQPYEMGRQAVGVLKALSSNDQALLQQLTKDGVADTGMQVVTPETFAEFQKYLTEKGLKSS